MNFGADQFIMSNRSILENVLSFLRSYTPEQFISRPDFETFLYRACIVVDDRLYVIGGQEGDFMAKPGSPIFKCSRRLEVHVAKVFIHVQLSNY